FALWTTAAIFGRLRMTRSSFTRASTSRSVIRATRSTSNPRNALVIDGHFASTTRQLIPAWNTPLLRCSRKSSRVLAVYCGGGPSILCSSPASLRVLRDPLQHDDRDDSLGPLRVILERREIVAVRLVQAVALRSLRDRHRPDLELLATDLDLSLPVLYQVVIPTGMRRGTALRGRDHVAVAITVVDEGRRPDLSALRTARGEEQQLVPEGPDPLTAFCAELVDRALVPVAGH